MARSRSQSNIKRCWLTTADFGTHHGLGTGVVGIAPPDIWLRSNYGKILYLGQV